MSGKGHLTGKAVGENTSNRELASNVASSIFLGKSLSSEEYLLFKAASPWKLSSPDDQEAFLQEAQRLKDLRHPHILPIISYDIDEEVPYILTEDTPVTSLALHMEQPLAIEEALSLISQIGQALHYAHQHGIVHGNLSPTCVYVTDQKTVLISDFLLTSLARGAADQESIVSEGSTSQSPEQGNGSIIRKEDDQYALGCLAYEMLTGRPPFPPTLAGQAGTVPLAPQRIVSPIAPGVFNPSVSPLLEQAILKAMAPEPTARHRSVQEFLVAMQLAEPTGDAAPLSSPPPARRRASGVRVSQATEALLQALAAGRSGEQAEAMWQTEQVLQAMADGQVGAQVEEVLQLEDSETSAATPVPAASKKRPLVGEGEKISLAEAIVLDPETLAAIARLNPEGSDLVLADSEGSTQATDTPPAQQTAQDLARAETEILAKPGPTAQEWEQMETLLWQEMAAQAGPGDPYSAPQVALASLAVAPPAGVPPLASLSAQHRLRPSQSWMRYVLPQGVNWKSRYILLLAAVLLVSAGIAGILFFVVPDHGAASIVQAAATSTSSNGNQTSAPMWPSTTNGTPPNGTAPVLLPTSMSGTVTAMATQGQNASSSSGVTVTTAGATATVAQSLPSSTSVPGSTATVVPGSTATASVPAPTATTVPLVPTATVAVAPTATATPTPMPTPTPTPTPTPIPASTAKCTTQSTITSSYSTGFVVRVFITNASSTTATGWTVQIRFTGSQQVLESYNSNFSQSGNVVTLTNLSGNGTIDPGATTHGSFKVAWSGGNPGATYSISSWSCS